MLTARRVWRMVLPRSVRRAVRGPFAAAPSTIVATSRPTRLGPGEPGGLRRVHVGSGPHNLMPDWWNVDIRRFTGIDEVADVTRPWPWRDLDAVYGEHFLEHLSLDGSIRFLVEAGAALRVGGRIRLTTPGLEWIWQTHFPAAAEPEVVIAETYHANRAFYGWGHMFLWSRPMLEHVLRGAGFEQLTFHDFGQSEDPAMRGLEQHTDFEVVAGWPSVWIVEAVSTGARSPDALLAEAELEIERYRRSGH